MIMIVVVNQLLVLVILVVAFSPGVLSSFSPFPTTLDDSYCNRNCSAGNWDGRRFPSPFGFSPTCKIQLNCSESGEIKIGEFRVANVTAESILVDLPVSCNRPIESLEQFFGRNYRMTSRNGLLLLNCSSPISGCSIPIDIFKSRLENNSCGWLNTSCFTDGSNNASFLDFRKLKNATCGRVFSSIAAENSNTAPSPFATDNLNTAPSIAADNPKTAPSLEFQIVELEWWVEGKCSCDKNAKCIAVSGIRNESLGYRCQCLEGYVGDGFRPGGRCRKGKAKLSIIPLIAAPACGVALLLVILVLWFRRKPKTKYHNVEAFLKRYGSLAPRRYHYSDVKKMTNSFKIKLGQGGYGSVYKGKLKDGRLVAVKVLKDSKGNGQEFINEVESISRTSHVNIVTLLGFCFQGDKKALIYEFMENGSLEKYIYGENSSVNHQLDWSTLFKIAVGIARGLEYLHRGCSTRILHFDIKPHNILLDEGFCPKISDFGLAKLCTRKESIISTTVRGTIGYIAPEIVCKNIGGVSHKSDVYSYGMMVLEMVGGRKNVDVGVDHTSEIYFPHWIYRRLDQGEELYLSGIKNEEEDKQARKMLMVSLWCIQTNPSSRPTVNNVLEMLEGPLEALQRPPTPYLYSPTRTSSGGST